MDLEKYGILLDVIESGNLTKVAQQHNYSASGISRMMQGLEEEMEMKLLTRGRDGVQATEECELLLPAIRKLLAEEEGCKQLAARIRGYDVGIIRIGVAYSDFYPILSRVTDAFKVEHPGVEIHFSSGYSSELLRKLEDHELDLCLISQRDGSHKWFPLGEEEIVAWIPSDHPLAKEKEIPLSAFEREPYIDIYPGKDIDNNRIFRQNHVIPNTVLDAEDSYAVFRMVEAGLGISMNHRSTCENWKGKVCVLPLAPQMEISVGFACREDSSVLSAEFLRFFREMSNAEKNNKK